MALFHLYEVSKLIEKEVEWWLPGAGRKRKKEVLDQWVKFHSCKMKMF